MKQFLVFSFAVLLLTVDVSAQLPYSFSVYYQAYAPLTGATLFHPGLVWNVNSIFAAPIGFPFTIDTFHCSNFYSEGANTTSTDTTSATFSGFILTDAGLDDRGGVGGGSVSHSPVRYEVTGSAGHQIFKFEVFNAGFDQQLVDSGFMSDSVDMQMWYYEDSGTVELRYGPSLITGTDYFNYSGTMSGFVQNLDSNGNGTTYLLGGIPANPTVQTVPLVSGNPTTTFDVLSSFPPSGTVYRFGPLHNSTDVGTFFTSANVNVYPTAAQDEVMINYKGSEILSYDVLSVSSARMIVNGSADNGITHIDVSNFPAGIYLLHLRSSADSRIYRFVKIQR